MRKLTEGPAQWAIPWPCVFEFYSVVTHPRIYSPPSTTAEALDQLQAWIDSPKAVLLGEPIGGWRVTADVISRSSVTGPAVHDARIAAICIAQGVDALITLDRDFSRFPDLRVHNLEIG